MPHDMMARAIQGPSMFESAANRAVVGVFASGKLHHIAIAKIFRVVVLPQGDSRAGAVGHRVFFDDPAFAPVGANQANLLCGRR